MTKDMDWEGAVESLYHKEYNRLFCYAYRNTLNHELSLDLVQETFLLAVFQQEKLLKHPNPAAWLMLTLGNLIANERRKLSNKDLPLEDAARLPFQTGGDTLEEILPLQLRPEEREILILRFEQQLSYLDMANLLGVSEGVCRKRVSRAVSRCRYFLMDD